MNSTTAFVSAPFKGFYATLTTEAGKSPCYVVNENKAMTIKDGTVAHCYKVKVGQVAGYAGWSGGSRPVVRFAEKAGWFRSEKISNHGKQWGE